MSAIANAGTTPRTTGTRNANTGGPQLEKGTDGSYTLNTGETDNVVEMKKVADNNYQVNVDGQVFSFDRDKASNLTINTGGGRDNVNIDPSVDVQVRLQTGDGADSSTGQTERASEPGLATTT